MKCDNCRWFNKNGFVPGFGDCTLNREVHSANHEACEHYEECEPQQHGEWTTESAIDYLTEIGWLPEHDRILTERPHGEWIYKGGKYWCSSCGEKAIYHSHVKEPLPHLTNFCPNCGAEMIQKTCGNCYWFSKVTVPCCDKDCEPTTENEKACDGWEEGDAE